MDLNDPRPVDTARDRPVRLLEMIGALLQAIAVFLAVTAWNPHPFLFDDNLSQWLPVTDSGIRALLSGQRPVWNPYILGGIRVDEVGYYGFFNPFMIAAHLLARTGVTNTISAYIFLTFLGGSIFAHLLARRLGSDWRRSMLLVFLYQISVTFWCHGHWYYIFNNFLMGPAILWGIHRFLDAGNIAGDGAGDDEAVNARTRRARAWQLGAILGLAAGLGNIQYTLSQWMLAAVMLLGPLLLRPSLDWGGRRGHASWTADLANLARVGVLAGAIAFPSLWMIATAGKFPLGEGDGVTASTLPLTAWDAIDSNFRISALLTLLDGSPTRAEPMPMGRVGGVAIVAAVALVWLARWRWRTNTDPGAGPGAGPCPGVVASGLACALVLGCFLAFGAGQIVDFIPVLQNFRFAFKWWFLIPPLVLELACLVPRMTALDKAHDKTHDGRLPRWLDSAALAAGLAWGMVDIGTLLPAGRNGFPSPSYRTNGFAELRERLDLRNYRTLPITAGPRHDRLVVDAHADQVFVERHLTANIPVSLKIYSGSGYHMGMPRDVAEPLGELTGGNFFYSTPRDLTPIRFRFPLEGPGKGPLGGPEALACPSPDATVPDAGHRLIPHTPLPPGLASLYFMKAEKRLEGTRFTLRRQSGAIVSDNFTLGPNNRITGYHHPCERFWHVTDGELRISGWSPMPPGWIETLRAAGVRYLLAPTDEIELALEMLRFDDAVSGHTPTDWQAIRTTRYSAIEVPGAAPLVSDADGRPLGFITTPSGVTLAPPSAGPTPRREATQVTVRFNFDPSFQAVAHGPRGRQPVEVRRNDDGSMALLVPEGDWQRIDLRIHDYRGMAALAANVLACALIAGAALRRRAGRRVPEQSARQNAHAVNVIDQVKEACRRAQHPSAVRDEHLSPIGERGRE